MTMAWGNQEGLGGERVTMGVGLMLPKEEPPSPRI